jgi:hypothetical protein
VATLLVCAECKTKWLPSDPDRWRAYLSWEEDLGKQPEVLVFCSECSQREFDGEPDLSE